MAQGPHQNRPRWQGGNNDRHGNSQRRDGDRGNDGDQAPMTAPFRFARINRRVHYPAWGNLVSHDVPFADGHNGSISIEITAKTPLMVGKGRDKRSTPGTVLPFRAPDGSLAIPGSGLQGVIRSILEVATFGKLGPMVKDRRFGMRDIQSNETADALYRSRITTGNGKSQSNPVRPLAKAGWLMRQGTQIKVIPCGYGRIAFDEIAEVRFSPAKDGADQSNRAKRQNLEGLLARTRSHEPDNESKDANKRYAAVIGQPPQFDLLNIKASIGRPTVTGNHGNRRDLWIEARHCTIGGSTDATIVITGKPSKGNQPNAGRKHREFLFYGPHRTDAPSHFATAADVPTDVWRDFLLIHEADKASGAKTNPNWQYWQGEFRAGRPVPVFYLEEAGKITAMGTAQMFKLAMPLSNHDLLRNSDPEHVSRFDGDAGGETGRFDMASLIFGAIGGKKDEWFRHSLKRRASFDLARQTGQGQDRRGQKIGPVALLSPKPSYYPFYVRQPAGRRIEDRQPYAAYHDTEGKAAETRRPELAGAKIWPVESGQGGGLRGKSGAWSDPRRELTQDEGKLKEVSSWLDAAPEGSRFATTMRVHNLREVELGALLWALSFGKPDAFGNGTEVLRHRLGGGKPYGLGEVEIRITSLGLDRNDGTAVKSPTELIAAFTGYMAQKTDPGDWTNSVQVNSLIKAATPTAYGGDDALAYIDTPKHHVDLRNAGWILPAFAAGSELGRAGGQASGAATNDKITKPAVPATDLQKGMRVKSGAREGVIVDVQATAVIVKLDDGRRDRWAKVGLLAVLG